MKLRTRRLLQLELTSRATNFTMLVLPRLNMLIYSDSKLELTRKSSVKEEETEEEEEAAEVAAVASEEVTEVASEEATEELEAVPELATEAEEERSFTSMRRLSQPYEQSSLFR